MSLGEKIAKLRSQRKLSQGELAEKLHVSRQSVSKWETDASIPELDKLLQLSDLFGITLDELVRADTCRQQPKEKPVTPDPTVIVHRTVNTVSTQRVIGFILLGLGLLCCVLALLLGRMLAVIGAYGLLCSVLCLYMKRYAGLVIGWMSVLILIAVGPYIFGMPFLFGYVPLPLLGVMLIVTYKAVRIRRSKKE